MLAPLLRQDPIPKPTLEFEDPHTEVVEEWEDSIPFQSIRTIEKSGSQYGVIDRTVLVPFVRTLIQKARDTDTTERWSYDFEAGREEGKRELLEQLEREIKGIWYEGGDSYDSGFMEALNKVSNLLTSHRGETPK